MNNKTKGLLGPLLRSEGEGSRASLRILSTQGRGVFLCWEIFRTKDPPEKKFFVDNLLDQIHLCIKMISVDRLCAIRV